VGADTAMAPEVTAELASLQGGYSAHFMHISKIYSFYFYF
jgi:hypothetical protein